MSLMMNQIAAQDVFDLARIHGASPEQIQEAVEYVFRLGATGTIAARNRCGDLVLIGLFYEKGWLG